MSAKAPRPVRRRFRFSARALLGILAITIVLAIAAFIFRWQHVRAREKRAVQALGPYGGVYSMASAVHLQQTGETTGWIATTFFNYVESVDLSPHTFSAVERGGAVQPVTDQSLALLSGFSQLRSLDLRDTQVTDDGIQHLVTLRRLETLDISGTQITDRGAAQLQRALPDCDIRR